MPDWQRRLNGNPLPWLLEEDTMNPSIRYFALRHLQDRRKQDREVLQAKAAIMRSGPVSAILDAQGSDGCWVKPGSGYSPKYRATTWQILILAELGADASDERVRRGCEYVLSHTIASSGAFSANNPPVPSGAVHCLNGNLLWSLIRLGCLEDERVVSALDWQARAITGEGEPVEYFRSTTSGPGFACGVNLGQPCGWGAVKAMRALAAVPNDARTRSIQRAIEVGAEFLLSRDPAVADYPFTERVSSTWFKFGFPLSYWSDVLETTSVLVDLGFGQDARLENAVRYILSKQDSQGRWKLENSLNGKMWIDIEAKGKPSKWVTLRALRVVKGVQGLEAVRDGGLA